MNLLNDIISRTFPNTELSCRECGGSKITAMENNIVSLDNPSGERRLVIQCDECGLFDDAIHVDDVRETVKAWLVDAQPRYLCKFKFNGEYYEVSVPGISELTNGFWINGKLLFTKGSDAKYWIPPGKVEYVTKAGPVRLSAVK